MSNRVFWIVALIVISIATFAPSAFGEDPNPDCNDRNIPAGRTIVVPADCRVHGDVWVGSPRRSGFKLFPDADAETGMVVDLAKDGKVYFPFGGGVSGQPVASLVRSMAKSGCGGGCAHGTNVVVWPTTARAES